MIDVQPLVVYVLSSLATSCCAWQLLINAGAALLVSHGVIEPLMRPPCAGFKQLDTYSPFFTTALVIAVSAFFVVPLLRAMLSGSPAPALTRWHALLAAMVAVNFASVPFINAVNDGTIAFGSGATLPPESAGATTVCLAATAEVKCEGCTNFLVNSCRAGTGPFTSIGGEWMAHLVKCNGRFVPAAGPGLPAGPHPITVTSTMPNVEAILHGVMTSAGYAPVACS
jgi:hypothetical protein